MTQVFTLPDLGEGLEDAELVRWLVRVGDTVAVDAPVAEVETAKAMVEVPCPFAGVVAGLHAEAGDVVAVGAPFVTVEAAEPAASGSGNVLIGYGTSDAPVTGSGRRALRRAAALREHRDPEPAPVTPVTASPTHPGPVAVASPVVRSLARTHGVDLRTLVGSGPDGLVVRADVERAVRGTAPTAVEPAPGTVGPATPDGPGTAPAGTELAASPRPDVVRDERTGLAIARRVPLRGVRKAVTTRLTRSRQEIPEATTWVDVDATRLVALRAELATPDRPAPGLLAILGRFVVAGLARFPELNARVDVEGEEIVHLEGVNLGIAAQTDRGLLVPVVHGAHALRTRALDAEIRRLTTAAREGRATTADLAGGSFTLNNYGVLGVDGSAAIINHPEVAILGIGRLLPRPWVVDGEVAVRTIAQLSLVFDHRVCDGGTAGGFLRFVADAVEQPTSALLDAADL
ncbi:dihydrolipoamide acetyltransferase family protein [Actinotalea solisilvae]|uniref:dihydrolipoamide acetyltransferase family protein n=1 Tax=Actinotalea solisilvae TaxID=2072922 RepID=UPI0018F108CC|nr:dihydrolipoamide acetyltransferase family protein [Actinotalea solisilvae]